MTLLNMQSLFVRYHNMKISEFKCLYKFEDYFLITAIKQYKYQK